MRVRPFWREPTASTGLSRTPATLSNTDPWDQDLGPDTDEEEAWRELHDQPPPSPPLPHVADNMDANEWEISIYNTDHVILTEHEKEEWNR